MSNIFKNPSNKAAIQAIEEAIDIASQKVCRDPKVDLENFDPWAKGGLLTDSSYLICHQRFEKEIKRAESSVGQNWHVLDLIARASTYSWLHGYACAREEALLTISAKNKEISTKKAEISDKDKEISDKNAEIERQKRELGDTKINLDNKTREAENSEIRPNSNKAESEETEPADEGQIYQKPRRANYLFIGIVIGAVITAIVCIIIDSQMMG